MRFERAAGGVAWRKRKRAVIGVVLCVWGLMAMAVDPASPMEGPEREWAVVLAMVLPVEPEEWRSRPPSEDVRREFEGKRAEAAFAAAEAARRFQERHATHDLALVAREYEGNLVEQYKAHILGRRVGQMEDEVRSRFPADNERVGEELERRARDMLERYPEHFVPNQLLLSVARQSGDATRARRLATEVAQRAGVPSFVRDEAQRLLGKLERIGRLVEFEYFGLDGRTNRLSDLRGKVVLVEFWATWCVPCLAELPRLNAMRRRLAERGFEILAISLDEDRSEVKRVARVEASEWKHGMDGGGWDGPLAKEFGVESLPAGMLIDRAGRLRAWDAVARSERTVEVLLAE